MTAEARFDPAEVARFENETWSRCARRYPETFGPLVAEAVEPVLDAAGVDVGSRVLDLGTGPGLVAAAARERGATVTGIDFSGEMIEVARNRHPDIVFQHASADELPFEDATFDAVVGNFVLHHTGRPGKVLQEAHRVLDTGGGAAFTVWAEMEKLAAFGLFFAAVAEHVGEPDLPHGPLFGVSDHDVLAGMLRDAGFRGPEARELAIAWRMPSVGTYLQAFTDWADLDAFPDDVRTAIETTVRENAEAFRSDGGFEMSNPAILVAGVTG